MCQHFKEAFSKSREEVRASIDEMSKVGKRSKDQSTRYHAYRSALRSMENDDVADMHKKGMPIEQAVKTWLAVRHRSEEHEKLFDQLFAHAEDCRVPSEVANKILVVVKDIREMMFTSQPA